MNSDKLQEAIVFAKANNLKSIEIDGIKMEINDIPQQIELKIQTDEEIAKAFGEDPFIGMTDEEILFYHSDYYDELQEQKRQKQEALDKEQQVRNV